MSEIHYAAVTIPLGAGTPAAAGTSNVAAILLPGTSYGGGITLEKVYFVCNKAVAAGSAPAINLITMNLTGGTLGTIAANGSAAFAAGTPQAATVSTSFVPGTVGLVAVQYGHETLSAHETVLTAAFLYSVGRGSA